MKVSDVMTEALVTVRSDVSLRDAATLMVQHRVSGLPVVDAAGAVIGMITEGDLIRRAELGTAGDPAGWLSTFLNPGRVALDYVHTHGLKVGEVMAREVITTSPDAPLALVVDTMESKQIKRLPVLESNKLVGIVSRADLMRALAQLLPDRKVATISDAELRKRVLHEIATQRWAPRATIDATVENGIVELRGAVTDDRERVGLRVIAENTPGVRGVHDRLIWIEPVSGSAVDAQ
jgi:CBS-domain-containing membrane protein